MRKLSDIYFKHDNFFIRLMSNSINASAPIENHSRVELAANKAATSNSIHVKQNVAPVISTESIFNKTKTVLNDLQAVKQKRQVEEGSVWTANTKKLSGFEKFYQIFKNILLFSSLIPTPSIIINMYCLFFIIISFSF